MNIFSKLFSIRNNALENPAVSLASPSAWAWLSSGEPTAAGEMIDDHTAMMSVTVYACVRIISESVASLPLRLYQVQDHGGKVEAYQHPLYSILSVSPNPEMTAFSFWEAFVGSMAFHGNGYAQIERAKNGNVIGLWPLNAQKTNPYRMADGSLVYKTTDGSRNGAERIIPSSDVLHCPLFSFDGLRGLSPIAQARQALGLSRAAEKFGARFFGNGSKAGGVLSTVSQLDDKTIAQVRESWNAAQGGQNQGKVAVLPGDWKYTATGISPEDSQFLQTRAFQRTEIAALFRLDPHMVGDTTRMSNSNHEQQSLQSVTDTLRPYMGRIESEIMRKLFSQHGNATRYIVSFDVTERLRGDFQTTQAGFQTGVLSGWLNRQDVRTELGLNPGPDSLNTYMVPVNMMAADRLTAPNTETPVDPVPTDSERSKLANYRTAYIRLFRDAVGRITHRDVDKRDVPAITQAFQPLYESLSDLANDSVQIGISGAQGDTAKALQEQLGKLAERAKTWTSEGIDETAGAELTRAIRSMTYAIARSRAEKIAEKALSSIDESGEQEHE